MLKGLSYSRQVCIKTHILIGYRQSLAPHVLCLERSLATHRGEKKHPVGTGRINKSSVTGTDDSVQELIDMLSSNNNAVGAVSSAKVPASTVVARGSQSQMQSSARTGPAPVSTHQSVENRRPFSPESPRNNANVRGPSLRPQEASSSGASSNKTTPSVSIPSSTIQRAQQAVASAQNWSNLKTNISNPAPSATAKNWSTSSSSRFNTSPPSSSSAPGAGSGAQSPTAEDTISALRSTIRQRVMESFQAGEKAAKGTARSGSSVVSSNSAANSSPSSSGSRVARLGEETLRALSGGLPIGHSNVDGDDRSDAPSTTSDGEYRYERKRQHIQRKRENFMRDKEPAAVKWTGSVSDGISDDGEKQSSDSSSYDPAAASSTVLDIAAMKRMYSGRLGQNSSSGATPQSGSMSRSDSQSISWRLYPQLPGQKRKSAASQKDGRQSFSEPTKKSNPGTVVREVVISDAGISIRELSSKLSKKTEEVKLLLENLGEDLSSAEDSVVSHSARQKRLARRQQSSAVDDKIIDADIAELVVLELGLVAKRERVERELPSTARRTYSATTASASSPSTTTEAAPKNPPRAPIVCVMGHVDHGKTTLMDHLRSASIASGEAGGITQKLSAFSVKIMGDKRAAFIDSPGHAAFSGMRTYGALATDIVILVVALDDGVRPQTIEAIKAAKDAKCTIVVALNKVDKIPAADRADAKRRVLSQLMDNEVVVEEYGGDVFCAEISGKTGQGVQALLEGLLLQAEVLELSAPTDGFSEATIIDARFEKGRGVVADCIVRWGKLSVGDPIFAGTAFGNVKSILDDTGKSIPYAGPSSAVQIIGLRSLPSAGQELLSTESEEKAKRITERRARVLELRKLFEAPSDGDSALSAGITVQSKSTSDSAVGSISQPIKVSAVETVGVAGRLSAEEAAIKMLEEQGAEVDRDALAAEEMLRKATLNVILKSDGAGTLEALKKIVASINSRTSDARIRVIHSAVGSVLKSDIELAAASTNGSIFAFNVGLGDSSLKQLAKRSSVDVFKDSVIYRLEDELLARLEALMPKERVLTLQGTGKVLQLFPLNDKLKSVIAGMSVTSGSLIIGKDVIYRVKRGGKTVLEESVLGESGLRRFKDTVSQVTAGNECGLTLGSYKEFAVGDDIECFKVEWKVKTMKVQDDENSAATGGYGTYTKGEKSKK